MITNSILGAIIFSMKYTLGLLPVASISTIPVVGTVLYNGLATMIRMWNTFEVTFPYATTLMNAFLYVIIPFELLMLVSKFIFGNRAPSNN